MLPGSGVGVAAASSAVGGGVGTAAVGVGVGKKRRIGVADSRGSDAKRRRGVEDTSRLSRREEDVRFDLEMVSHVRCCDLACDGYY